MAVNVAASRLTSSYPALNHPLYRRLLIATLLFEMGLTIFEVALFWTASRSIAATAFVGTLFALIVLPASAMAIPAGLAADRIGPRGLVLAGAAGATGISIVAAWLTTEDRIGAAPAALLALAVGLSLGAWAVPSQVLAGLSVPIAAVPSAVALSVLPSGIGALLGGGLAGAVLSHAGSAAAFLSGAVLLTGAGIAAISLRPVVVVPSVKNPAGPGMIATLRWIRGQRLLLGLILLAVTASVFLMGRMAILPALVQDVLHAGPDELGLLVAAGGLGTLAGSLLAELLGRRFGRGPVLLAGLIVAAICLAGLGFSHMLPLSMALAGLTAAAGITWQVTSAAMVQQSASPAQRGRILGIYDLFRLGLIPVGSIGLGLLTDLAGASIACLIVGAATILVTGITTVANGKLRRLRAMPVLHRDPHVADG